MGRCKERIPVVLNNINWYDFISYLNIYVSDKSKREAAIKCKENEYYISDYWHKNPDQRLTQVLVNIDIIENFPGTWYYLEETEYLIVNKILKPEEILFWGSYGKDGKQNFRYILLNDMESNHIEACLKTQKNMNKYYRKTMEKILRFRKLQKLN